MWKYDSCIKCFAPLHGQDLCPRCRYQQRAYRPPKYALAPFTELGNRYLVGTMVGHGGFGVTYAALDTWKNRRCAIKEYLPTEWAYRDEYTGEVRAKADSKSQYVFNTGREKYIREAESLSRCKSNPIVVTIREYFKENNTGYIVMEFLDGQDLEQLARSRNGRMDVAFATNALMLVGTALSEIHKKGILHRDVKPQNIFYTRDGEFKLLDFGSARDYVRAEKMQQGMSVLLTKGYAPPEQYSKNTKQGPYTDVYALCATVYKLISGDTPKDGMLRAKGVRHPSLYELKLGVSEKFSRVIEKGMAPEIKDRYQDFQALFNDLHGGKTPPPPLKPKAFIQVLSGSQKGSRGEIPLGGEIMIGQNSSCQLVIKGDATVDNEHCMVECDSQYNLYLMDKSVYGTYGSTRMRIERGKRYSLQPGDTFYLGNINNKLQVCIEEN